ncbi:Uncharacterised protein [[Pasteurella] mairii]|uniref:Uncharacterized protein n=1 Tax=[Pasteurella] mairii TaxID=757 RepID=A0A379B5K6_9PAST|nr:Uncharacterised protein [[Pasteurella] mairii]
MNALYNQIETALTAQGWANGFLQIRLLGQNLIGMD